MRPRARDRATRTNAARCPPAAATSSSNNRLGSGSDYTVFLNFLGIPIVDMSFDGPYGVYHSMYDNHQWVARIGDPGFRYHAAMARLWGVMALRLANADVAAARLRRVRARLRDSRFIEVIDATAATPIRRSPGRRRLPRP